MSDESSNEDPKIIVDDDWKNQVQKEKEEADQPTEEPDDQHEIPPASFPFLVTTLSTQALASMGYVPDPMTGQPNQHLPMAKHFVDTLGVLKEKTEGNLTEDESSLLTETLHQLRMAYVNAPKLDQSAPEEEQKSTIELP